MSNSYAWSVTSMDCYPQFEGQSNVVFNIKWKLTASDDINQYSFCGSQDISFNSEADFTPYKNLTENIVLDWVKNTLGEATIASIIKSVDVHLASMSIPRSVSLDLPWA